LFVGVNQKTAVSPPDSLQPGASAPVSHARSMTGPALITR
jgi:hypothetical protein